MSLVGRKEELLASMAKQGTAIPTHVVRAVMCEFCQQVYIPHRILPLLQSPSNPHQIEGILQGTWKEVGLLTHYEVPAGSSNSMVLGVILPF